MSISPRTIWVAMPWVVLQPAGGFAEGVDTEHIYGFMIGADVGDAGEREFQTTTAGRFSKQAGSYQALGQQLELEIVPIKNFRIELETTLAAYDLRSVPGLVDPYSGGLARRSAGFALPIPQS